MVDAGERGVIGVGFSGPGFKLGKQPGWEPGTYGYHGDDGLKANGGEGRGSGWVGGGGPARGGLAARSLPTLNPNAPQLPPTLYPPHDITLSLSLQYHGAGVGEAYGPRYSSGDVVGAGLDLEAAEIFFTCAHAGMGVVGGGGVVA